MGKASLKPTFLQKAWLKCFIILYLAAEEQGVGWEQEKNNIESMR